jgi:hypothetical protein
MKLTAFILLSLMSFTALAQSSVTNPSAGTQAGTTEATTAPPKCPECDKSRGETEKYRDDSFGSLMVGYQLATTWVVGKSTASWTQILSRDWSIELEYSTSKRNVKLFGSELGEMREDRYTLFGKYYVGNSFHVSGGPFMYDISTKLDEKFEDQLGNRLGDRWKLQGYGLSFAFGNRWQSKSGITWGVDWIRMNVPFIDGLVQRRKDLDSEDKVEGDRDYKILRRAPTFTFVGVSVGYTF